MTITNGAEAGAETPELLARRGKGLLTGRGGEKDVALGAALIDRAALEGDAGAWRVAASLAAVGVGAPPDWTLALDRLQTAAELGDRDAQEDLAALADAPARGAGLEDWRQLRRDIRLQAWRAPPVRTVLSEEPRVRAFTGVISPRCCDRLIAKAKLRLAPAGVYDGVSGIGRGDKGRTNSAAAFEVDEAGLVVLLLRERLAMMTGVPVAAMETPQVLRYRSGESFRAHCDFLDASLPGHAAEIARFGQRIATALVYLNEDYEGGETHFLATGLRHRGRRGDGLSFASVDRAGLPDPRSAHAGEPPTSGEKWVFSQWMRARIPAD